jgi:hypothetical protein
VINVENVKSPQARPLFTFMAFFTYPLSKKWPADERYSLTDQIRRSSRSVCANIAEAWRKRRYEASFISKLSFGLNSQRNAAISPRRVEGDR